MDITKKEYNAELNNRWKKMKYETDPEWRRKHIEQVILARKKKKEKLQKEKYVFRIQTRDEKGEMKTVFEHITNGKPIETNQEQSE